MPEDTTTEEKPRPDFAPEAGADAPKPSTEIVFAGERGLHTGEPAYKRFHPEMVALIGKAIMPVNYSLPELYYVLEMCATYQLDPFSREIWPVRMQEGDTGPITMLIGRDGLLAIAERHSTYRGFRNQAVHANDAFEYHSDPREMPDGTFSHVAHSFTPIGDRGALVGSWAEVYREGRPPVFFYAPLDEYMREGGKSPWRRQKTAMIMKCALANALRLAFRISGLYIGEEMSNAVLEKHGSAPSVIGAVTPTVDEIHEDPYFAARFRQLFDAINERRPNAYLPAKQRLMVQGKTDDELRDLLLRLISELEMSGGVVPPEPEIDIEQVVDVPLEDDNIPFGDVEDAVFADVDETPDESEGEQGSEGGQGTLPVG